MTHDNLPIPHPEQDSALTLRRANQLIEITDIILARARQENGSVIPMEDRRRQVAMATPPQSLEGTRTRLIAQRYHDNGDGTVTDVTTGLQWKRCAEGQTWTGATCSGDASRHDWETASRLSSHFAGHSDWRLPTIDELKTLVYCSSGQPKIWNDSGELECEGTYNSPTIQTEAFPNTPGLPFGSSSLDVYGSYLGNVNFDYGKVGYDYRNRTKPVRLVRCGE